MNKSIKKIIQPFLFILLFAVHSQAQPFKVIEDKQYYTLQLIDSSYFISHGNNANAQIDTSQKDILNNSRGLITLSITSGQAVKFRSVINPAVSDYVYAGIFTCCGLYLVHGKIKYLDIDNYYLINSGTGKIDTLTGYPVLSSSGTYAAADAPITKNTMLEMTIKNLSTGISTDITCPDETEIPSMIYKWENDSTLLFDGLSMAKPRMIYYRLVMKE